MACWRHLVAAVAAAVVTAALGAPALASTHIGSASTTVHAYAKTALHGQFLGELPKTEVLPLYVSLQGQRQNEIDRLIAMQNAPGSPYYRHYLTPQEYGRYFGASNRDYAAAIGALRAAGFVIDKLVANHKDIEVHAPAGIVASFFNTPIDVRSERGRVFFTNRYEPQYPAGFNAAGVAGLENYVQLHPHHTGHPKAHLTISGNTGFGVADIQSIYNLTPVYSSYKGSGVTVVDATEGLARSTDFSAFTKQFGLTATLVNTSAGKKSPTDGNGETTLDVEWMAGIAPAITVNQVTAASTSNANFDQMYSYIINDMSKDHVVSTSWGQCEALYGSDLSTDESLFQQAYTEGQWWLSAAGDDGVDDCANGTKGVDFPGSSPYVVSVGGTSVTPSSTTGGNFTGYGSEVVWDDTEGCTSLTTCNSVGGGAGGGGVSTKYGVPSWQKALVPSATMREVPDVSFMASDCDSPSGTSVCKSGKNGGYWVYFEGAWQNGWGGTSFAAPEWGAFLSLIQNRYGSVAIASPLTRLYALAGGSSYHTYFHDVTSGCNSYDGVTGFCAASGFDEGSGLGSFNGSALEAAY